MNTVLKYFQQIPSARELSLKELTLELVMLLLLVTGQRGQTIHLLHLRNMTECNDSYKFAMTEHLKQSRQGNPVITLKAYQKDKSLCLFTSLKNLNRTRIIRGTEPCSLVRFVKPHKRVSRDTIGRWVKISLDNAGIDTTQFKTHEARQASTSAAKKNAVRLQEILDTAGWAYATTFACVYDKPILQEEGFANGVLCKKPVNASTKVESDRFD